MRGVYEKVRGSKDYYIRYTDAGGKRHREHVGRFSTACEALVNRRREVREGRFVPPKKTPVVTLTFAELAEKMLIDKAARFRPNTMAGMRRLLRRLRPLLGPLPARDISTAKINEVLLELKYTKNRPRIPKRAPGGDNQKVPGEISGPTLNGYLFFMSSAFRYGIENGYVDKNPIGKTLAFEKHEGIIRYLTNDEEAALRRVIRDENPFFEPELDLALHTGLRKHEQRLLTWDKIDLDRGILTVPSDTKTGRRFIPINSTCRQAIEHLHELSKGEPRVCPFHWRSKGEWLQKWLAKAKVMNFRWHDLRHTFASRLVMAGVDLRTVQQFMGHSSIETTMRYAHLSPEHGKAAIEKLVAAPAAIPAKPPVRITRRKVARVA